MDQEGSGREVPMPNEGHTQPGKAQSEPVAPETHTASQALGNFHYALLKAKQLQPGVSFTGKNFADEKSFGVNKHTLFCLPRPTHVIMSSTSAPDPSNTYSLGGPSTSTSHGRPLGVRFDDNPLRGMPE